MDYRYETTTVGGFVQQLASCYMEHGYWFYVQGTIPESKDLAEVDEKLLTKYQISVSKFQRCRRKQRGIASIQYLRYERTFLVLATYGIHDFFTEEYQVFKDVRRVPIQFMGYSIGYHNGHPTVEPGAGYLPQPARLLPGTGRASLSRWHCSRDQEAAV